MNNLIWYNHLKIVVETINYQISKGNQYISVKTILRLNKIDKQDRSKINFFWRILQKLGETKFILLENSNKKPYIYRIRKKISLNNATIKLSDLLFNDNGKKKEQSSFFDWQQKFKAKPKIDNNVIDNEKPIKELLKSPEAIEISKQIINYTRFMSNKKTTKLFGVKELDKKQNKYILKFVFQDINLRDDCIEKLNKELSKPYFLKCEVQFKLVTR